jgi:carboxypeptidase PM20D1
MTRKISITKRIIRYALGGIVLLIAALLINTVLFFDSRQEAITAVPSPALPENAIAHFQQMIQFKTITYDDSSRLDSSQFIGLREFLEQAYPNVHEKMTREIVNRYSLLFHWPGKDTTLESIIFIAHMDVVPVEETSLASWKSNPFAGAIMNDSLWGRGTVDDKVNMVSILESVEKLLREGFEPQRSVYLVFGHDEEAGGRNGARAIAKILRQRKVKAKLVMDEGGYVTENKVPGIVKPVALLGTSEKGYLNLLLTAEANGGHSSFPEKETAIDILSRALVKIRTSAFPPGISASMHDMIGFVGPELPFFQKVVFANAGLFEKIIIGSYTRSSVGNAMMRTTAVPTIVKAGIKENVIPGKASAVVNFRLLPGDSISWVIRQVKRTINDSRIRITSINGVEASGVTSVNTEGFQAVKRTVYKTFPVVLASPFLLIGGTDSKYFQDISPSIIRFSPVSGAEGFHGVNERISLQNYRLSIWFYEQLIRELNQ